jgi:hypothetical protein
MDSHIQIALACLHYIYPAAVFTYFASSSLISICTLQTLKASLQPAERRVDGGLIIKLVFCCVLTFIAQLVSICVHSVVAGQWIGDDDAVIGLLSCILVFGVQFACLVEAEHPVWYPHYGCWILALVFEPIIETLCTLQEPPQRTSMSIVHLAFFALRYLLFLAIGAVYLVKRQGTKQKSASDEERQSLLPKHTTARRRGSASGASATSETSGYGSTIQNDQNETESDRPEYPWEQREREAREHMEKRLQEEGNWLTYAKGFMVRRLSSQNFNLTYPLR